MFTARYGKGNKTEQIDRRTDRRAWKQRRAPTKATSRRKLEKNTHKINKMIYLVHFLCLTSFSDVYFPTSYRIQKDVPVKIYLLC